MVMSSSGLSSDNVPAERIRKELEHAASYFSAQIRTDFGGARIFRKAEICKAARI
jgi:hypothetical protein